MRPAAPKAQAGEGPPPPTQAATDKEISQLTREVAALEQIKSTQVQPADLAIVKTAGAPVLSRPSKDAQVVLMAEADDELQVLDQPRQPR